MTSEGETIHGLFGRIRAALGRFARRDGGATTVDFVVVTAVCVGLATAIMSTTGGAVSDASTDVKKCLKRQSKVLLQKENWSFDKRMRVAKKRCGRL